MKELMIATLPLVGVAIGALLQYWASRSAEKTKQIESQRSSAYSDYLRAVSDAAHLRSDEDLVVAKRNLADAKARIAIYGSSDVIAALSRFEEIGAETTSNQSQEALVTLVAEMRSTNQPVTRKEIHLILLGPGKKDSSDVQS